MQQNTRKAIAIVAIPKEGGMKGKSLLIPSIYTKTEGNGMLLVCKPNQPCKMAPSSDAKLFSEEENAYLNGSKYDPEKKKATWDSAEGSPPVEKPKT